MTYDEAMAHLQPILDKGWLHIDRDDLKDGHGEICLEGTFSITTLEAITVVLEHTRKPEMADADV